jgi:hypothetical protein
MVLPNDDATAEWASASSPLLRLLDDDGAAFTGLQREWWYRGRVDDQHLWEGVCGRCRQPVSVRADDRGAAAVRRDLDTFGDLECGPCATDRVHEFDHIARAASELDRYRFRADAPLAGTFRGPEHESSYREWCARRGLRPLPSWPETGPGGV